MNSNADSVALTPERVEIVCADGVRLCGHFFAGTGSADQLPVLLSPATGVKQQFYFRFAQWLAHNGNSVLVFDYRGIGMSLHGQLKDCQATLAQWGRQDQVAAIEWLVQRTGCDNIVLVGNSAGAQMLGLLPNHRRVARLVWIASSTGWFSGMRKSFQLKARFALLYFLPLAIRFMGYAPTSLLGLGENLPSQVALQWGQWCNAGGYATNAKFARPEDDFHSAIHIPMTFFYATDDDIANGITVEDLARTFPNAIKTKIKIEPAKIGLKSIGHLDWFRSANRAVWPTIASAINGL